VVTDSTVKVSFQGSQSIATFSGYTTYALKDHSSTYKLDIGFRTVLAGMSLYQEGDIWKWSINSLTPGVTVMGGADLDQDIYRRIQKYEPPKPFNRYILGLSIAQHGGPAIGYRADQWNFSTHYDMFNPSSIVLQNIYLDIMWCPF
jgi:hypothetical protein